MSGFAGFFVILAVNQHDAQGEYRRLVSEEFERLMGLDVRIVLASHTPRSIEGLRVSDFSTTDLVKRHKNYEDAVDCLRRSVLMTNYRSGDK